MRVDGDTFALFAFGEEKKRAYIKFWIQSIWKWNQLD